MPPKISEPLPPEQVPDHAVRALVALGFEQPDVHKTVQALHEKNPALGLEELIRESLKILSGL
jgi:Holliday junction resolvasome RuvABC DNA-binding subunit